MTQRLSGLDAGFVYGETPSWHMHAGALLVFDPSTAPQGRVTVDDLRELLRARLHLIGPFRHRLVRVPFGLDRPLWVADADLDLHAHVHHVGVPPPGGPRELAALAGELFSYKLDRSRPLWEMWVIDGLADANVAVLVKVHHAAVDGVGGAALYQAILDPAPDTARAIAGDHAPVRTERVPSELELLAGAVWSLAGTPLRGARTAGRLAAAGLNLVRLRRTPRWRGATFPFQAPRTSLNQPITPHRDLALCSLSLADVKAVKGAFGVTVNDVVLAVCAGALRAYLLDRDELPSQPLVAQVPVATRRPARRARPGAVEGNRVAVMGAALATQLADPVERLRAIHTSAESGKALHRALGDDIVMRLADVAPPGVLAAGVKAYTRLRLAEHHPPIFNLILSNVPGPPVPLYAAGARLVGMYGIGPLLDGGGLNITAFSYDRAIDVAFTVCPEVVPDPWFFPGACEAALAELVEAATARARRPRRGRAASG